MKKKCEICKKRVLDDKTRQVCDDCILRVLKKDEINKKEVKS
jgi:hypothetical protein